MFEQFKQERFRAMQSKQQQSDARCAVFATGCNQHPLVFHYIYSLPFTLVRTTSPYWGKLEEATVGNYIEEVEDAPDTHYIVVHLYQPVRRDPA